MINKFTIGLYDEAGNFKKNVIMKKLVIKYQPNCSHLLNDAVDIINDFNEVYLEETKIGLLNGVLWVVYNGKSEERQARIYVYHTKTQIVCDIR